MTERNNSTQHNMNLFFLQNCYKLKTQDSPFVCYLPPTRIEYQKKVWTEKLKNDKDIQCSVNQVHKNYLQIQV